MKAIKEYVQFNKNEKIKNHRKAKQLLSTGQVLLAQESLSAGHSAVTTLRSRATDFCCPQILVILEISCSPVAELGFSTCYTYINNCLDTLYS